MYGPVQHSGLDFYMTFVVLHAERSLWSGYPEGTTGHERKLLEASPETSMRHLMFGKMVAGGRKMGVRGLWLYY